MSTLTSGDLDDAIRARLMAFVSDAGDSIGTLCDEDVYARRAPNNVETPYVVFRRTNGETDPDYGGARIEFDVEAECVGTDQREAELLADLAQSALLTWHASSATLGVTRGMHIVDRDTPPLETDPPIRDRYETLVTVRCSSWPRFLTDALT